MKPTKEQISETYSYHEGGYLVYARDSGRYGRFKSGSRAGSYSKKGIRMISLSGKSYQEHQLIWTLVHGDWPLRQIRHINGNLSDNSISNLEMDGLARGNKGLKVGVERLREMLDYCPETGVMRWKVSPRNRTRVGDIAGRINDGGYLLVTIDKQTIRVHRAAWAIYYGEMPSMEIDHINRIRDDNRICNLRLATRSENGQNASTRTASGTGVKGVHFRKDTLKYSAYISVDKQTHWLGCFSTLPQARSARIKAEKRIHPFRVPCTGA